MCILKLPGDGVEDSSEAVLGHSSPEEGIGGQGAEGVVADLGVRWRGTLADEVEVGVGLDGRSVQED